MGIVIDFVALILLYTFCFYKRWKATGKIALLVNTAMYIYLSFVLYFTLMPIITSLPFIFNHPYMPMNLIPFIDILERRGDFTRQVVLNVVMTIPFGFLLPCVKRGSITAFKALLYALLLGICIEILQPLINGARSSDITDVITNTIGGIIGYTAYVVCKPFIIKVLFHWENTRFCA
ncbi:MAG TPA: VanZ family protein [Candidatus Oscillibacter excrementigallinarum]|uniref:VanZ family protein n=1 Tax=Candidatus Oscillibacter excrementigallinarum TaxID=2838716 RepID=A0A9D2LK50_9FIRM|nr:VanZ family protein [Candidatus Oscillibacter excrementigallinarum]